jgi:hypothetical protein
MTDDKQLERFKQAVDDKNEKARESSEAGGAPGPREGTATEEQAELHEQGRRQDARDERAKSSRHGQVTADNWNQ